MDRGRSSPPTTSSTNVFNNGRRDVSVMARMKKQFISFTTSLQEGLRYFKALFVGQAKKLTARDDKEATEADLQTAKMQVEAADAAEDTKKRLDMAEVQINSPNQLHDMSHIVVLDGEDEDEVSHLTSYMEKTK